MTDTVLLPLSRGKFATIDAADFEKVGHFKWHVQITNSQNFYAVRNTGKEPNRKKIWLHCELLGLKGVDHKNGDGLDCRRENLRPATSQQNHRASLRKIAGTSSEFRGVSWDKSTKKWTAQIGVRDKKFYVGVFVGEEDAARAYDKKAKELGFFKEALNFP